MAFAISGQPHFVMSKRAGINEGYDNPMNRPGPGYLNSPFMRNEVTPSSVNPWENNFKPVFKTNVLGVFCEEKTLETIHADKWREEYKKGINACIELMKPKKF